MNERLQSWLLQFAPLNARLTRGIAASMLAGPWEKYALERRLQKSFGNNYAWMRRLSTRVMKVLPGPHAPAIRTLCLFLRRDVELYKLARKPGFKIVRPILKPVPMSLLPGSWNLPELTTDADLCRWLNISQEHLAWFASMNSPEPKRGSEPLRHYFYKWIPKRSGGWRLLEMPKSKLKDMQRRILSDLLDAIPPHPSAHGFKKGGSIVEFVAPHSRRDLVLRMDLKDFFASVQGSRIHALFRTAGYSEHIARVLTSLCTNSVPSEFMRLPDRNARLSGMQQARLRTPHLPQGAPTSPALANLCARRFDARVTALSAKFGWRYTRYADDLLFSGTCFRSVFSKQFQIWIGAIALEEHFEVNTRKTRAMRAHARQYAAGLVLNEKPNLSREEYDELKAILHNCAKHGPASQNRDGRAQFQAHLSGRIGYVCHVNPQRGQRLKRLFEKICWPVDGE